MNGLKSLHSESESSTARKVWTKPLCLPLSVDVTMAGPDNDIGERTGSLAPVGNCGQGYAWSKSVGNCQHGS